MKINLKLFLLLFILSNTSFKAWGSERNQSEINLLLSDISTGKADSVKVKKYLSVADLYSDGSDEKLEYSKKALETAREANWREGIGLSYYHMGWFYFFDNKKELAIESFLNAIEYSEDPYVHVYSYGVISNTYSWIKRDDLALEYAQKGLENVKTTNASILLRSEALIFLGDVYRYNDKEDKANKYYLEAFNLLDHDEKSRFTFQKMVLFAYLSDSSIEDPFLVFSFSQQVKNFYDKATPMDKQSFLLSLIKLNIFLSSTVESEKIKEYQLQLKEKQRMLYIGGISALAILVGLLIWQNRSRMKANRELEEANEMKSRFFGILNHDLRRPVAGLISYLQLKTVAPDAIDPKDAIIFEQKTINTAKNLLENMEDLLFWCKDQMQSFTPDHRLVSVNKLFEDTKTFFNYDETIQFIFDNPHDLKIKTDENYAKTIMRNLTANGIKVQVHVDVPIIKWSAYEEKDKIILSVTNNGEQISQDKIDILYDRNRDANIKEGLGLKIIRDLTLAIGCKIEVDISVPNETTFKLIFKRS